MNYIGMSIGQLSEMEARAFNAGDTEKADMPAAIAELIGLLESARGTIEEMKDKPADFDDFPAYKQFFSDCFERLNGHYPCASVTSDYDCSIIFEAISKGEGTDE